jgi:serine/threonine protein kinase
METQQKTHPPNRVLAAFALGRLPAEARPRVDAHLRTCPICSDFVRQTPKTDMQALLRSGTASQAEQSTPSERARGTVETPSPDGAPQKPPMPHQTPAPQPPNASISLAEIPPALREQTKYRIIRLLGRGGMGSVYEAHHERMNRRVAIKVINPELVDHPQAVERFNAEVRAVAMLDHANVARAYDAETFGSLQAIIMEFVPGRTVYDFMKARLKAGHPLAVSEACRRVRQALVGLQHAHEQGIAHRDLKPQNLMLTRDKGIVKILDFGLAKLSGERSGGLTKTNVTMGTYEYMAPEQALDAASAGIRSDIYSLGCTLYYLLAGVLPFDYPTDAKLLMAHQTEIPRPITELRPDVPRAVSDLLDRMLAKKPADRPQTPAEAAQVLLPYARGENPLPSAALPGGALPHDVMAMIGSQPAQSGSRRMASAGSKRANRQLTDFIRRRWIPVSIIALAAAAAAIVAFAGLFKIRTSEGTISLSVNQPNAEVLVDGQTITVQWGDDGKTAQITAPPGKHRIEVKKQGFVVSGKEVTLQDGGHEVLSVTLEDAAKEGPAQVSQSAANKDTATVAVSDTVSSQPAPPTQFPLAQWVDVLRLVDTGRDVVSGRWSRDGAAVSSDNDYPSLLALPPEIDGGYDLAVEFTRTSGTDDVAVVFPVGSQHCNATLSAMNGKLGGLYMLDGLLLRDGHFTLRPSVIENGRRYRLLISVRVPKPDVATIDMSLDGKPYADQWRGRPQACSLSGGWVPRRPKHAAIGHRLGTVVFHSVQLKMVSGSAFLDPAAGMPSASQASSAISTAGAVPGSASREAPAFQQWMNGVAAMPAEQQVEAVVQKLREVNPGFDGREAHKVENGVVTELQFVTDIVTDISPVRALSGLTSLICRGSTKGKGVLTDLSPLKGMPLTKLNCGSTAVSDLSPLRGMRLTVLACWGCRISDLSPLQGMSLESLFCQGTQVSDLSPLKGMPLSHLVCFGTRVSDLSPLRGMPLTTLHCGGCPIADLSPLAGKALTELLCPDTRVSDLSPLRGMPLKSLNCMRCRVSDLSPPEGMRLTELYFWPGNISKGMNAVRNMPSLLSITTNHEKWSVEEFWKSYDAGHFGKPTAARAATD